MLQWTTLMLGVLVVTAVGRVAVAQGPGADAAAIPAERYVSVKDGQLHQHGKRVRFWGAILSAGPGAPKLREGEDRAAATQRMYRDIDATADRLAGLGFNMVRVWHTIDTADYAAGDGSPSDIRAYWFAALEKRGISVWMAALNRATVTPDDVAVIDDPATADAWRDAIAELQQKAKDGKLALRPLRAVMWDKRLTALSTADKLRLLDMPNHHKGGLRLADDPQMAVFELSNEERWVQAMLRGDWQKYPQFFQDSLLDQWSDFLRTKYGSDDALRTAWLSLLPGESLDGGSVQLLPLQTQASVVTPNDANPQVRALLESVAQSKYHRHDFHDQRGRDVIEFLCRILAEHKKAQYAAVKEAGRATASAPLLLDTGEGYHIQTLLLAQHGDAVSVCTYMTGTHNDRHHRRFPWNSGVEELPRLGWNVPWVETNRMPDKPYLVYEVNIHNPAKYRAEFPWRVAALAAIQDFDAVCWHVWNNRIEDAGEAEPYSRLMDYDASHNSHPQGLNFRYDEVLQSAITAAGWSFRSFAVAPAPEPTTYTFGRRSAFDPATMDYGVAYGKLGHTVMATTYRRGTRMAVNLEQEGDTVTGPVLARGVFEPCPIRPNDQIEYDWQRGHLKLDSPAVAAYTGFFAQHGGPVTFTGGGPAGSLTLRDVTINNPDGIAYPVTPDERYIAFAAVAQDGLPLPQSKRVTISLVSTSFNTGFQLNHDKLIKEYIWHGNDGLTVSIGKPPALVARAGAILDAPALDGMRYTLRDWHLRPLGEGTVTNAQLTIPADQPIFLIELHRD